MSYLCRNFDSFPLEYQEAINQLLKDLEDASSLTKKRKLYNNFTKNYTMLPELWNSWLVTERDFYRSTYYSKKLPRIQTLENRALNDFFNFEFIEPKAPERLNNIDYSFNRCLDPFMNIFCCMYFSYGKKDEEIIELAENIFLCYPHSKLDFVFDIYKELTVEPISQKWVHKYNLYKNVYEKIMAAADDDKEWFDAVAATDDFEFIKQNTEFRIANNPANKCLWKYYIEYIKKGSNNLQTLLSVYCRYCRLFIDDQEMKDEYNKAKMIRKRKQQKNNSIYIPSSKSNNNTFLSKISIKEYELETSFQNCSNQSFAVPKTVMTYMINNFSLQTWQKLFQTCKYFYYKKQTPIIHRLELYSSSPTFATFNRSSLFTSFHERNLLKLKNAIISNSLQLQSCDSKLFKKFLSKIFSSQIIYLRGGEIKMTLAEFDFLVGHGKVEVFMTKFKIVDESDDCILIEELLARFPYGRKLNFEYAKYDYTSAVNLITLKQYFKFDQLFIKCVTTTFDPHDYSKFAMHNTTSKSSLYVYFAANTPADHITAFKETIENSYLGNTNTPSIYIRAADIF